MSKPDLSTLGARIYWLRSRAGMTYNQLAIETNIAKSYLWRIENDEKVKPSAQAIVAIASALSVSSEDLLGDLPTADDLAFFDQFVELSDDNKHKLTAIMQALKKYN